MAADEAGEQTDRYAYGQRHQGRQKSNRQRHLAGLQQTRQMVTANIVSAQNVAWGERGQEGVRDDVAAVGACQRIDYGRTKTEQGQKEQHSCGRH